MKKGFVGLLLLLLMIVVNSKLIGQTVLQPYNLNFELGVPGYEPYGWLYNNKAFQFGYTFQITDKIAKKGKKSLEIKSSNDSSYSMRATIQQSVYAKPYINKRVEFSAEFLANVEMPKNFVLIWLNVRDKDGNIIQSESNEENPIFFNTWERHRLFVDITPEASSINFGFALDGQGSVFIDDVVFKVVDSDVAWNSPAKAVNPVSMPYLTSFAEIFGLLKYFYPGDEIVENDWERILLNGIGIAEKSKSDADFIDGIEKLFRPIAPLIKFHKDKTTEFDFPKPDESSNAVAWLHQGIASDFTTQVSNSKRVSIYESRRREAGIVIQASKLKVESFKGLPFELTIEAKANLETDFSFANLLLRFEDNNENVVQLFALEEPFIISRDLKTYSIRGIVPESAIFFRTALNLYGEGVVSFDNIEMAVFDSKGAKQILPIANSEFQSVRTNFLPGWLLSESSAAAGYKMNIYSEPNSINKMLVLESDVEQKVIMPKAQQIFSAKLPFGYNFSFPLVSYVDSLGNTLPNSDKRIDNSIDFKPPGFVINDNDRESRMATIIDAWNYVRHFSSFPVDSIRLYSLLQELLVRVSTKSTDRLMLESLNELFSLLNDNQARVWKYGEDNAFFLPLIWKWLDGKLIVTNSTPDSKIKIGDMVREINSIPVENYIKSIENQISASNPTWKRLRALAEIRSGNFNSSLKLKIERAGTKPFEIELKRNVQSDELVEERPQRISMIGKDIIYCDMTRTNDVEFNDYLKDIENDFGIIFDARGISNISENMIGLLTDKPINSASQFIDIFVMPWQIMKAKNDFKTKIKNIGKLKNKKIVFIADERSGGLSETVLGIVKENKIATIIGRETSGGGGEVTAVRLPGFYFFSQTVVKSALPSGKIIHGSGVVPDVEYKHTIDEYISGEDLLIKKATEYLNSLR